MTLTESLMLGFLQGLTEFLPVSSSGHLVFAETFLGMEARAQDLLGFDVLLHLGSLGAIIVFYRRVWWKLLRKEHVFLLKILVGTIPAGAMGWLLSDIVGPVFHTVLITSVFFGMTGTLLLRIDSWRPYEEARVPVRWRDAVWIGCLQALALLPGISRSGVTIAGGYFCGLRKQTAVDFSFLLAGPIIAGAAFHTMQEWWLGRIALPSLSISMVGFSTSFIVSMGAIGFMRYWVQERTLMPFGAYLLILSLGGILSTFIG